MPSFSSAPELWTHGSAWLQVLVASWHRSPVLDALQEEFPQRHMITSLAVAPSVWSQGLAKHTEKPGLVQLSPLYHVI
jgi:hypothetical protein